MNISTLTSSMRPFSIRASHSTETGLVMVVNDLLMAADLCSPSLLILLDLSTAFDTVDHGNFSQRLREVGITGTALDFYFYLTERREYVVLGNYSFSVWCCSGISPWASLIACLSTFPRENTEEIQH